MISGIYQVLNTTNGHNYVGQAYNLERRKRQHFNALRKGEYGTSHWQNAFNKYGEKVFRLVILKELWGYRNREALDLMLTAWEQFYFDTLHPEYNDNLIAGRPPGFAGRRHSKKSRRKMKKSHLKLVISEETRRKMNESHLGFVHSEETRRKISKSHMGLASGEQNGNYGDHRTFEERYGSERAAEIGQKISELLMGLNSGKQNGMYGDHRTLEQRFGSERAAEIKLKRSETMKKYWARIRAAKKDQDTKGDGL